MELNYPKQGYERKKLESIIKKAAYQELYSCCLYLTLSQNKLTKNSPKLREIATKAFDEDLKHYLSIFERFDISEDSSPQTFISVQASKTASLFKNCQKTIQPILNTIQQSERQSITYQEQICSMTLGHDYQTFDLAYAQLNDNIHHEESINLLINQQINS